MDLSMHCAFKGSWAVVIPSNAVTLGLPSSLDDSEPSSNFLGDIRFPAEPA